jgi:hypothetical protein
LARIGFPNRDFVDRAKELEKTWEDMVSRANCAATIRPDGPRRDDNARKECIAEVVRVICEEFYRIAFFKLMAYSATGRDKGYGWFVVTDQCNQWIEQLDRKDTSSLRKIQIDTRATIIDALNVGWECRQKFPGDLKRIEEGLRTLCGDIFEARLRK